MKRKNFADLIGEKISELVTAAFGITHERAVTLPYVYQQVGDIVYSTASYESSPYLIDVYYDGGKLFALVTSGGKLMRHEVVVDNDSVVSLGACIEIDITTAAAPEPEADQSVPSANLPAPATTPAAVATPETAPAEAAQRSMTVHRQADGKYRFLVIACTSVLDRVGEIDSTALFDDFIARIHRGDEKYPYLTFFHLKEKFRMGQADWVAREGHTLLASGLFDESDLAKMTIEGLAANPGLWGISIGYTPDGEPVMERVAGDIKIPVYRTGIWEELSILPEASAAALFTAVYQPLEVKRMKKEIQDALRKLIGNDEKADEFMQLVDGVNERVAKDNLIARSTETSVDQKSKTRQDAPPPPAPAPAPTKAPAKAEGAASDKPAEDTSTVEMDEETMKAVVEAVTKSEVFVALQGQVTELATKLEEIAVKLDGAAKEGTTQTRSIEDRLAALEDDEDNKRSQWAQDLPSKRKISVSYRPRNAGKPQQETSEDEPQSFAEVANSTLAGMKLK